jgi:hypothetical protein
MIMYDDDFGGFDEYNDWDATSCANGDYNAFEEEQVFQDGVLERKADEEEAAQRRRGELEEIYGKEVTAGLVYGDDGFCYYCSHHGEAVWENENDTDVLCCTHCGFEWNAVRITI